MWHRLRPSLLFWSLLACCAAACGPSFQAVYECDVRFEHCYAMDEQSVSPEAKKDCWRSWLHTYTYGQSRDRVEYAATRYGQLTLGASLPSEDTSDGGPGPASGPAVAAPVPTNAFAPPPNVATAASASRAPADDGGPRAPGADCSDACQRHWNACREDCAVASSGRPKGDKARTCEECDRGYRACMPACFGDGAGPAKAPHAFE